MIKRFRWWAGALVALLAMVSLVIPSTPSYAANNFTVTASANQYGNGLRWTGSVTDPQSGCTYSLSGGLWYTNASQDLQITGESVGGWCPNYWVASQVRIYCTSYDRSAAVYVDWKTETHPSGGWWYPARATVSDMNGVGPGSQRLDLCVVQTRLANLNIGLDSVYWNRSRGVSDNDNW